jgi:hypothetical protein
MVAWDNEGADSSANKHLFSISERLSPQNGFHQKNLQS